MFWVKGENMNCFPKQGSLFKTICNFVIKFYSLCNTSKSTSFDLRKIKKSFPPVSKTNIHILTKKNIDYFKKHKFCKPKYIHKLFVLSLHVSKITAPVPATAFCVVSSPLFIPASVTKSILVSAFIIFVISNVIIESVNYWLPVYRFIGLFIETSVGHFY